MSLIAIEGIDGSGKSTLAKNLAHLLRADHTGPLKSVVHTAEPYDPQSRIRKALRSEEVKPGQMAIMFAADRFAHLDDVVIPALRNDSIVVCDRYTLSTLAYQTLSLPDDFVLALVEPAPKPDITILLDIDPSVSIERLTARGLPLERYERKLETQYALRHNYLKWVNAPAYRGENTTIIVSPTVTATQSADKLAATVFAALSAHLANQTPGRTYIYVDGVSTAPLPDSDSDPA